MSPAEIQATLNHIDAHRRAIAIGGIIAMGGGFVQFGEALRLGFRHKTHAIPFLVLVFYLANDFTYVALYDRWFEEVHHPLVMQSWYWYVLYPLLEFSVLWQAMTYSRAEIFPGFTKTQAWLAYASIQIAMVIFFNWLTSILDDYFLAISGMLTIIGSNMNICLLSRRASRKGQSLLYAWTIAVAAGPINWFLLFPAMTPRVDIPVHYALGSVMTALSFSYIYLLWRTPPFDPAPGDPDDRPA